MGISGLDNMYNPLFDIDRSEYIKSMAKPSYPSLVEENQLIVDSKKRDYKLGCILEVQLKYNRLIHEAGLVRDERLRTYPVSKTVERYPESLLKFFAMASEEDTYPTFDYEKTFLDDLVDREKIINQGIIWSLCVHRRIYYTRQMYKKIRMLA